MLYKSVFNDSEVPLDPRFSQQSSYHSANNRVGQVIKIWMGKIIYLTKAI